MRSRARRMIAAVSILTGSGILLSGPGTGCSSFLAETALTAADFSFIFDCQNGVLGGTFDVSGIFADCAAAATGP